MTPSTVLKTIRTSKALTQKQLAKKLKTTTAFVSLMENNNTRIPKTVDKQLIKLSPTHGVLLTRAINQELSRNYWGSR